MTLVDAGDAAGQGHGTLTDGEYLVDIMNECGYDFAIPATTSSTTGWPSSARWSPARTRSTCPATSPTRTGNLMFDAYAMREYGTGQH
ncbi:MAG: hypothetical protein ACLSVD_07970 [Eggerthellaceae bacterium]